MEEYLILKVLLIVGVSLWLVWSFVFFIIKANGEKMTKAKKKIGQNLPKEQRFMSQLSKALGKKKKKGKMRGYGE